MDEAIGVKGVVINSNKFSAQFRPRCYWTNIRINSPLFEDKRVIADIIEDKVEEHYFLDDDISRATKKQLAHEPENASSGILKLGEISRDLLKDNERQRRVYSVKGKSPTLLARADTPKILVDGRIRKLTPLECERLQCVPDNYTLGFSRTSRYKMIGNGFTVGVISHILKSPKIGSNDSPERQLRLAI
jgi:site-specific DNA-cytosine methylase